jgi:DNA repair photolyase
MALECIKCGVSPAWYVNEKEAYCDEHHDIYQKLHTNQDKSLDDTGLEYTSPFSVNNQVYFCGIPFRLDSYNGCTHGCTYCFVRSQELTAASRNNRGNSIVVTNANDVRREIVTALDTDQKRESIEIEWMRHKVPIHWGSMSDPFQGAERKYGISKQILEYFSWYKYPVVVSTKGIMPQDPEYLKLIKEGKYIVQASLITDDDDFIKQIEPGTPTATERLNMLEKLAMAGVYTGVRIQPMIPSSVVENKFPDYVRRLAKIGVKHIQAEGYKVPVRAEVEKNKIWKLCPDALKEYQYNDVSSEGFEKVLPSWRKWKYIKVLRELCKEYGMTFGAADNDLRDMGDVVCCCGLDNVPGFENIWRYQASQAAVIAKRKGWVSLDDMQQFWHGEKGLSWHNDEIRFASKDANGTSVATPKFAVDFMWERGGAMSPECMFSMKKATLAGKMVYVWTDPIPKLENKKTEQLSMF